jgi:hypothetical protein
MSSDESDNDETTGRKVYRAKKTAWRSKDVTSLLRTVDRDYNTTNGYGNTRAGNPPRHRVIRGGRESKREAPPGLPSNFYDRDWYENLTNREKNELAAQKTIEIPDITMA